MLELRYPKINSEWNMNFGFQWNMGFGFGVLAFILSLIILLRYV